jgi:hypothetical protein
MLGLRVLFRRKGLGAFPEEHLSFEGKAQDNRLGLPYTSKQKGGSLMILVLVKLRLLVGRLTALIFWSRKGLK